MGINVHAFKPKWFDIITLRGVGVLSRRGFLSTFPCRGFLWRVFLKGVKSIVGGSLNVLL